MAKTPPSAIPTYIPIRVRFSEEPGVDGRLVGSFVVLIEEVESFIDSDTVVSESDVEVVRGGLVGDVRAKERERERERERIIKHVLGIFSVARDTSLITLCLHQSIVYMRARGLGGV